MSTSSTCRDRTQEFLSVTERLRKSTNFGHADSAHGRNAEKSGLGPASSAGLSEFNKRASRIGLSIHQTSEKLSKLAKLAKRTSMFDDPAAEIQELTAVIKQDITALNAAIADLQSICDARNDSSNRNKHTSEHSTTVVDSLKSRLMTTTKEFKDVLTLRTENLKVHENRRKIFSGNGRGLPPFHQPKPSSTAPPPPWASANGTSSSSSASQLFNSPTSQKRPALEFRNGHLQQELVAPQDSYLTSRAEALHNVETTIVELSNIFKDLATMVAQQGEMAIRIDQDIDDSLANVEGAQSALLKYFNRVSSNKWLIIKLFFVLIVFLLIFVVFVA